MKRFEPGRISCSSGFLLLVAALIYLDGQSMVLCVLLAAALHELAHWTAVVLLGGRVRALRLTVVGAVLELDGAYLLSYGREVVAALAGPMVNLVLAWGCARLQWHLLAGLNCCLGVLNLLPIGTLDGGRILRCLLSMRWPGGAQRVVNALSVLCAGAVLGLGWAAWQRWGNLTLLCVAVWLLVSVIK